MEFSNWTEKKVVFFYALNLIFIFIVAEVIFGYAPFVSNSFDELEKKILDDKKIEVKHSKAFSAFLIA